MADFVCIGDASQDNFFFIDEEIKYGEKIPVERFAMDVGGNAANVAVGLARLGVGTELVTIFGADEKGAWVKKRLLLNGVGLENSATDEEKETNISAIIVLAGERTILTYHARRERKIGKFPTAGWIFLSDVSIGFDPKAKGEAKLAFNPTAQELRKGREYLQLVVAETDVLIVNKEELEIIGTKGPKITAVTDGPNGVDVFEGGNSWHADALPVEVVEPTGAGDAFSAGFLAGLFYGKEIAEAIRWGLANSKAVISKLGAQTGLLTIDQMREFLGKTYV